MMTYSTESERQNATQTNKRQILITQLISTLRPHVHRKEGPVLPQHGMRLPRTSKQHGSVGLLVRDVKTKVIHEHVGSVDYPSPSHPRTTVHRNHSTEKVLLIPCIVVEIGVEERIRGRSSKDAIRLHVEVHGNLLHALLAR